jgi:KDO2-lipid IV(A) lauroyltransferase
LVRIAKNPTKEQSKKPNKFMLIGLLRLIAKLPLSWLHCAGGGLGWLAYLLSPAYASRLRDNLLQSNLWRDELDYQRLLHENIAENGKAATELIAAWFRPVPASVAMIARCEALHVVEEAERKGKGVIYLTPHLGCFDVAALWVAQRCPITVLYRPPKIRMLQPLIEAGRGRDRVTLAPASLGGVRLLLKALKCGNALGILPDQVPSFGEGAWADFFGRKAYTMTLVGRLVEATGATPIMIIAERLPRGGGYVLRFAPVDGDLGGVDGPRALNAAVEKMVGLKPGQYLWSDNRYKVPAGVQPPPPCS